MSATAHSHGPTIPKRRSDRIFLRIPLLVQRTDLDSQDFGARAFTQMVSRFGASIVTNASFSPDQQVTLIPGDKKAIQARVIGQISIGPEGNVYGLAFLDNTLEHWGIRFPTLPEPVPASTELECCRCHSSERVRLNDLEAQVLGANNRLSRICPQCGELTIWRLATNVTKPQPPVPLRDVSPAPKDEQSGVAPYSRVAESTGLQASVWPQQRKYPRVRVEMKACIAQPGSKEDIVSTIDVSRGGVLVRSDRLYATDTWVQLAMPYTPAATNIFIPAQIVRRRAVEGAYEYGIQYVRAA